VPLVEFGHHVSRVYFSNGGPRFLANHETQTLDQLDGKKIEDGKWYSVMVEAQNDTIMVQIEGISTLRAKNGFPGKTNVRLSVLPEKSMVKFSLINMLLFEVIKPKLSRQI